MVNCKRIHVVWRMTTCSDAEDGGKVRSCSECSLAHLERRLSRKGTKVAYTRLDLSRGLKLISILLVVGHVFVVFGAHSLCLPFQ